MKPTIGRIVHYVSYGTPGGEYGRECRAAMVTQVHPLEWERKGGSLPNVGLFVANPTGLFLNESVAHDPGRAAGEDTNLCHGLDYAGGTWHWPERAEEAHVPGTRPPRH